MTALRIALVALAVGGALPAQGGGNAGSMAHLPDDAALPIVFTRTVSAAHARPGDPVQARTTQAVRLSDGREVPSGSLVKGHVLASKPFQYDKTPYATQVAGTLEIQIDSLDAQGQAVPLHVALRALADPFASQAAWEAKSTDLDSLGTTTQVGGDLLVPSQSEIRNQNGDVIGYNKKGGQFAHLLAAGGGAVTCKPGNTEQPVSRFSASACGLYGFGDISLTSYTDSQIGLSSTHVSPAIDKHSTALLESLQD
ncbi:hypothetical protein [Terriglobus aquaticus]|uniref:Uncharacterized protein n=1 Tax=Terriglobus aquaticus TaxID=940139 RepID=A0ABW9KKS8_9BACT|nr:hypothetical protein [Terriglobus aquaticus]